MRQGYAGHAVDQAGYVYDVERWLNERGIDRDDSGAAGTRNQHWFHMYSADVISMPDKWEYPWFAAWDLAFHAVALTLVDEDFAKDQLELMLRGPLPAPERPAAGLRVELRRRQPARARLGDDLQLPPRAGQPGRRATSTCSSASSTSCCSTSPGGSTARTATGSNLFEGGFLGLDNIGVFDRSAPLPTGGYLEQADGTAWMALFCQNMLEIALELALDRPTYEELALKFFEHFLWIAAAMMHGGGGRRHVGRGGRLLLRRAARCPDGSRAAQGALDGRPAAAVRGHRLRRRGPAAATRSSAERMQRFLAGAPGAARQHPRPERAGRRRPPACCRCSTRRSCAGCWRACSTRRSSSSDHGIRSLSRYHLEHPYVFQVGGAGVPRRLPAGRVRQRDVRRQLELARSDLDAGQRAAHPGAAPVLRATTATTSRSSARPGSGRYDDALRGGAGAGEPAGRDLPARRRRAPAGLRRHAEVPATTRTGATTSSSTSTSTATTAPAWAPATRRAGPASSRDDAPVRDSSSPEKILDRQARRSAEAGAPRPRSAGRRAGERTARAALSLALPDQHPRLPAGARAVARAGPPRWTTSPDAFLDDVAAKGFDWVWFLGVWQTGPARARDLAARTRSCAEECQRDAPGSARRGHRRLAASRSPATACTATSAATRRSPGCASGCARAGCGCCSTSCPTTRRATTPGSRRTRSTTSTAARSDLARAAAELRAGEPARRWRASLLAYGRDPYFDGWPDTFQLNYRNPAIREAQIAELLAIARPLRRRPLRHGDAAACPSVPRARPGGAAQGRSVLARGDRARPAAVTRSSCSSPRSTGTWSGRCMQAGFDYTYDKRLYDRLRRGRRDAGARAPARRGSTSRTTRALSREPRRAAGRGDVPAGRAQGRGGGHATCARPALPPRGPARGPQGARLAAPGPRTGRADGRAAAGFYGALLAVPPRAGAARRRLATARVRAGVGRQPDRRRLRRLGVARR